MVQGDPEAGMTDNLYFPPASPPTLYPTLNDALSEGKNSSHKTPKSKNGQTPKSGRSF